MRTVTEKDLRELQIRRKARVIIFKRACRLREKHPSEISLSQLSMLRSLINEADEDIDILRQENMN